MVTGTTHQGHPSSRENQAQELCITGVLVGSTYLHRSERGAHQAALPGPIRNRILILFYSTKRERYETHAFGGRDVRLLAGDACIGETTFNLATASGTILTFTVPPTAEATVSTDAQVLLSVSRT